MARNPRPLGYQVGFANGVLYAMHKLNPFLTREGKEIRKGAKKRWSAEKRRLSR